MMRLGLILLFSILLLANAIVLEAAIPIQHQEAANRNTNNSVHHLNIDATFTKRPEQLSFRQPNDTPVPKKEDSGINGILSFLFIWIGIFPLAIVFGIIGIQKHRKLRGLAMAGLVLASLILLYVILVLAYSYGFFMVI